ncbi:MAG: Uma2 family endonuclease [Planctomycetota bacterium]|nr:Uma2 family endonuclease [Planctomycetota bacterium]
MSTTFSKGHKWTYEDYVNIPEDGLRHEIIAGEHLVNPSPSTQHQYVSKRLQYQLYVKIELAGIGVLYGAPIDVQLSEFDIVQPDLVIILNENIDKITPTKIQVAPHLVVEILSPSTASHDRTIKKELYERARVSEYWIVDPFDHHVEQWVLRDGGFVLNPKTNVVQLSFVEGIAIDFDTVW